MRKVKYILLLVVLMLCCGCGDKETTATTEITEEVTKKENPDDKYREKSWLQLYDWNSLDNFLEPKNLKVAGIDIPFSVSSLAEANVCELSDESLVTIGDKKNLTVFTPLSESVGLEEKFVPVKYLWTYEDFDGTEKGGESFGAIDGEIKIVNSLATLTFTNSSNKEDLSEGGYIFDNNSMCCLSVQYPYQPYLIQPDNCEYENVEDNIYYSYYPDYRVWLDCLIKYNLGKPFKIYGCYTPGSYDIIYTDSDGNDHYSKEYINYHKETDSDMGWDAHYKLVFLYGKTVIVIDVKEQMAWNSYIHDMSHRFEIYSMEIYNSTAAYTEMAGYMDQYIDVTEDFIKTY